MQGKLEVTSAFKFHAISSFSQYLLQLHGLQVLHMFAGATACVPVAMGMKTIPDWIKRA